MTPWWRKHPRAGRVCETCGGIRDVHRGMCRKCRRARPAGEAPGHVGETPGHVGTPGAPAKDPLPAAPGLEPSHSRPWVRRGGG